jgi:triosephosphate isomerase
MQFRIFVNLKRFDVPRSRGGVCPRDDPGEWIEWIIEESVERRLGSIPELELVYLLPEALILPAVKRLARFGGDRAGAISIGSQGVYREDIKPGGNFGAFTSSLPATAAKNMGCRWAIIGHSEERKALLGVIEAYDPECRTAEAKRVEAAETVDALINREVHCAVNAGLEVLLCVGESLVERGEEGGERQKARVRSVLRRQLLRGLHSYPRAGAAGTSRPPVIGYEPIWAIGPGKTPPGPEYIGFVSSAVKEIVHTGLQFEPSVVYGGGLKEENAQAIAGVPSIGGGLVALTRFEGEIGFEPEGLERIIQSCRAGMK